MLLEGYVWFQASAGGKREVSNSVGTTESKTLIFHMLVSVFVVLQPRELYPMKFR